MEKRNVASRCLGHSGGDLGENSFSVMRQTHLVASFMVFSSFLLGHFVNSHFTYVALLVGFGLGISGVTGFCPMTFFLEKMPWNRK